MECRESGDILNSALCDELLAEIFSKVCDPADLNSVSLACKRWQRVQRIAKCRLGLYVPVDSKSAAIFSESIASLLAQHPYITCLSIKAKWHVSSELLVASVVSAIASSCMCLTQLHFTAGPLSVGKLEELTRGCPNLYSLEFLLPASACFLPALCKFTHLQELTLRGHGEDAMCVSKDEDRANRNVNISANSLRFQGSLKIAKVSLINMRSCASCDLRWLWHSCDRIEKLEFSNCDVVGDSFTMSMFAQAILCLKQVKLLRCRGIAGQVMMLVSKHSPGLKALTVHDGADTEGLCVVLQKCRGLELLDLRLPLDLSKEDLTAIGQHGGCLRSLRLHSCWMATGGDMQSLARNINPNLEELVLVRCKAIFQDPGTLSSMGQSLSNLKSIDLSENEYLADKELVGMLAANGGGVHHLYLWKCCRLTDKVLDFIGRRCVQLESIDIRHCDGMSTSAVNNLLLNCGHLKMLSIEPNKISSEARRLAFARCIALVDRTLNRFSPS